MSTQPEASTSLDPFGAWRTARDAGLETWAGMMIDLVNSEAYSQATSQWLDAYLTVSQPFKAVIEKTMTQVLTGLNMPTRTDVTSLAERMTNVEMRLDDLDARLDDIEHSLQALSTQGHQAGTPAGQAKTKAKEVQ